MLRLGFNHWVTWLQGTSMALFLAKRCSSPAEPTYPAVTVPQISAPQIFLHMSGWEEKPAGGWLHHLLQTQAKNHHTKIFSSNLSDICLGLDLRDRWKGTGKCLAMSFWKPRKSSSLSPSVHRVPPTSPLWPSLSCSILKWQHGPCCRCFSCSEMARDDIFPPEVSNTPSFHLHRKKTSKVTRRGWCLPSMGFNWIGTQLLVMLKWCCPGCSQDKYHFSLLFPTGSLIAPQICKERRHTSTCRTCG